MFISVVLPAPFSPSRPSTSPAWSVRSTWSAARTAPKLLQMPRMARSSAPGMILPMLVSCPRNSLANFWDRQATQIITCVPQPPRIRTHELRNRNTGPSPAAAGEGGSRLSLVGDRCRLVDIDAEGAVHDLLGALG